MAIFDSSSLPHKKRPHMLAFSTKKKAQKGETNSDHHASTSNCMTTTKRVFASKPKSKSRRRPKKRSRVVVVDQNIAEEKAEEDMGIEINFDHVEEEDPYKDEEFKKKVLEEMSTHPTFLFFTRGIRPKSTENGDKITEFSIIIKEKRLTGSDADPRGGQARLAMPGGMIGERDCFLTPAEKEVVKNNGGKLDVTVFGSVSLKEHKMKLVKWDYAKKTGWKYVLNEGWNQSFRDENFLKIGELIQICSFRRNGNLCIGIVALTTPTSLLKWGRTRPRTPRISVRHSDSNAARSFSEATDDEIKLPSCICDAVN